MHTSCASPTHHVPETPTIQRPLWRRAFWWMLPALVFVGLLWPKIDAGTLWHHDELLTANRTREILTRGDPGMLTLNFAPDFRKPPLQYWLCAVALRALPGRPELAVRLPSLLSGAACLLALASLARAAYPKDEPAVAWTAVLALAGCGYFILMSRLGLLDTGAALWLTLALTGCQLARTNPRWWWFTGVACVAGAWQKAPYAFAAWGLVLAVRACSPGQPSPRRARAHLAGALFASVLVAALWWVAQIARNGFNPVYAGAWRQVHAMSYAHEPADVGFRPYLYWFWLARDWALPGLCAPVAVVAALWTRGQRETNGLPAAEGSARAAATAASREIGWVCAVHLLALAITPFRVERYLVVVMPLLALLSMRWLRGLPARAPLPPGWQVATVRRWLLAVALATTLPTALFHYFSRTPGWPGLRADAQALGRGLSPGESVAAVTESDPNFLVPGFMAFYGGLRGPWRGVALANIGAVPPPCRGLCRRQQWPAVLRACPGARPLAEREDWIVWERPE